MIKFFRIGPVTRLSSVEVSSIFAHEIWGYRGLQCSKSVDIIRRHTDQNYPPSIVSKTDCVKVYTTVIVAPGMQNLLRKPFWCK